MNNPKRLITILLVAGILSRVLLVLSSYDQLLISIGFYSTDRSSRYWLIALTALFTIGSSIFLRRILPNTQAGQRARKSLNRLDLIPAIILVPLITALFIIFVF